MLNSDNIIRKYQGVHTEEIGNPFLPWEPKWYPGTMITEDYLDAANWFIEKNMKDRDTFILDNNKRKSYANKLRSKNIDSWSNKSSENS